MTVSSDDALAAGYIETITVVIIEQKAINIIEFGFISDGIELRKYISSGNKVISNVLEINSLMFST